MADTAMIVAQRATYDVEKNFGVIYEQPTERLGNAAKLNAAFPSAHRYPWFFPGGNLHVGRTIDAPIDSARAFFSQGLPYDSGNFGTPRSVTLIADHTNVNVIINNTSVTATISGAVLTFTAGYTPSSADVGIHLEFTAGTGLAGTLPRWYAVTAAAGSTWTLDRDPTASGTASAIVGVGYRDLWRDSGHGRVYDGFMYSGNANLAGGSTQGGIGMHVLPQFESGHPLNGKPTGKHTYHNCTFHALRVGILAGVDMRQAYEKLKDDGGTAGFYGAHHNHADHLDLQKVTFRNVGTCCYFRNRHSVSHVINDIHAINFNELFYMERAGQLRSGGIECGGQVGTVLRIGPQGGGNNGMHSIIGAGIDGNVDFSKFKLLDMDSTWDNSGAAQVQVRFQDIIIDTAGTGVTDYATATIPNPIVVARGGAQVILDNVRRIRPGSLFLKGSTAGNVRWPHIICIGCSFDGCTTPVDAIKRTPIGTPAEEVSSGNYQVSFYGCRDHLADEFPYGDGRFINGGVGWDPVIYQSTLP